MHVMIERARNDAAEYARAMRTGDAHAATESNDDAQAAYGFNTGSTATDGGGGGGGTDIVSTVQLVGNASPVPMPGFTAAFDYEPRAAVDEHAQSLPLDGSGTGREHGADQARDLCAAATAGPDQHHGNNAHGAADLPVQGWVVSPSLADASIQPSPNETHEVGDYGTSSSTSLSKPAAHDDPPDSVNSNQPAPSSLSASSSTPVPSRDSIEASAPDEAPTTTSDTSMAHQVVVSDPAQRSRTGEFTVNGQITVQSEDAEALEQQHTDVVVLPPPQAVSVPIATSPATEAQLSSAASPSHQRQSQPPSLLASFRPEVKQAWSVLFGSRYEDDPASHAHPYTSATRVEHDTTPNQRGHSLLKEKFERERRLDQQIQTFKSKHTKNPVRTSHEQEPESMAAKPRASMCTNVFVSPFEKAGLAPTVVRFCIERALQSTCQLTQQLHAISLDEPTFNASTTDCTGLFVMQWELEAMLVHLFGASADAQASRAPVLAFEDQGVHFPLEMMMSASWYLPFGDLSRLRMLVAQITRRHLNERKLAALNGCLHRQVLLLPHSARLQELLLELSVDTAPSPWSKERTRRMLELLSVQTTKSVLETIGDRLPALSPFELTTELQLSSVVSVQRVLFFRYLISALALERTRTIACVTTRARLARPTLASMRKSQVLAQPGEEAPRQHRKPKKSKGRRTTLHSEREHAERTDDIIKHGESRDNQADEEERHSDIATVGSTEAAVVATPPAVVTASTVANPSTRKPQLQRIRAEIETLVTQLLCLTSQNRHASTATSAHRSAVASLRILDALINMEVDVADDTTVAEWQGVALSLQAVIEAECEAPAIPTPISTEAPVSHAVQVIDEPIFPPPYATCGPSYWTFDTPFPELLPSVARSVPKGSMRKGTLMQSPAPSTDMQATENGTFKRITTSQDKPMIAVGVGQPPAVASVAKSDLPVDRANETEASMTTKAAQLDISKLDEFEQLDPAVQAILSQQNQFLLQDLVQDLVSRDRRVLHTPSPPPLYTRKTATRKTNRWVAPTAHLRSNSTANLNRRLRKTKPPTRNIPNPQPIATKVSDEEIELHLAWASRIQDFYALQQQAQKNAQG